MLSPTELEQAARDLCPLCQRGYEMQLRDEKGHTLRFRDDTKEWVHDFTKNLRTDDGLVFEHRYCQASELRKKHGR